MSPNVYIIAGPKGAGKTTFAGEFLPHYADCRNFINADLIAQGVAPLSPETAAVRAGRLMLAEIDFFARRSADFGFETTLAGRGYLKLVRELKHRGYQIHFFFLWVPSAETAISRIQDRVLRGGHDVPEPDVRRRYHRSISNFFTQYRQLGDSWALLDNSETTPFAIALENQGELRIMHAEPYRKLVAQYGAAL